MYQPTIKKFIIIIFIITEQDGVKIIRTFNKDVKFCNYNIHFFQ